MYKDVLNIEPFKELPKGEWLIQVNQVLINEKKSYYRPWSVGTGYMAPTTIEACIEILKNAATYHNSYVVKRPECYRLVNIHTEEIIPSEILGIWNTGS